MPKDKAGLARDPGTWRLAVGPIQVHAPAAFHLKAVRLFFFFLQRRHALADRGAPVGVSAAGP